MGRIDEEHSRADGTDHERIAYVSPEQTGGDHGWMHPADSPICGAESGESAIHAGGIQHAIRICEGCKSSNSLTRDILLPEGALVLQVNGEPFAPCDGSVRRE